MRRILAAVALLAVALSAPLHAQTCEPGAPPPVGTCVVNPPTTWGCWIARLWVRDGDGAIYPAVGTAVTAAPATNPACLHFLIVN